jgi:hypothetical protein
MQLAPIVLFAYNRPWHVKQTLLSLASNELAAFSDLYIYCDGPKPDASDQLQIAISSVRKVIREQQWCKNVTIIESISNKGLANSIIEGVTDIVRKYGTVIVVEDDVLLSKYFLQFMNEALSKYKTDENVLSIGSWNYFCPSNKITDNFFLRYPDSIAWATFDRAWELFEPDANRLLINLKKEDKLFKLNADCDMNYFEKMLENQIHGSIDSWAIRWTASAILHKKLTFYPQFSLSKHIGFGEAATHEKNDDDYNKDLMIAEFPIKLTNITVTENPIAIQAWKNFIKQFSKNNSFKQRIISYTPSILLKIYSRVRNNWFLIIGS